VAVPIAVVGNEDTVNSDVVPDLPNGFVQLPAVQPPVLSWSLDSVALRGTDWSNLVQFNGAQEFRLEPEGTVARFSGDPRASSQTG